MDTTDLGDRMKYYENKESKRQLMPMTPICIRLDGKNFSKYTKGLNRPYDERLTKLFIATTKYLVKETGAKIGFTESDEISLILYSDTFKSQTYLNMRVQKLTSVLCSMATAYFNANTGYHLPEGYELAVFDCRVWNVPNKTEAVNALLWREQDATKNSISMAASDYFSHKELQGKNSREKQDMLMSKGINWNVYPNHFKRGTFVQKQQVLKQYTSSELAELPAKHNAHKDPHGLYMRHEIVDMEMPIFSTVINREAVVFDAVMPITKGEDND